MRETLLLVLVLVLFQVVPLAADGPESDGRMVAALTTLEHWMDAQLAYEEIPSLSMGIVFDGELIWSRSIGHANVDRQLAATPDTQYSICSISKLFTAIAVMQLRDAGKLDLDEPIATYLPWFEIEQPYSNARPVTLRSILTHSAGLPRESDFPYWTAEGFPFPESAEIRKRVAEQEMLYPPETSFQYSNLGLTLAGEVVAAVSGRPFGEYVRENILKPLDLKDTAPELPRENHGDKFAVGYGPKRPGQERQRAPYYAVAGIAPAAGFASTINDLARFAAWQLRLLENGEGPVIDPNTLREMQRVHWMDPDWDSAARGLGFGIWRHNDKTLVGHGGACPGYKSVLMLRPQEKLGIVFMSNGVEVNSSRFAMAAYDLVSGPLSEISKSDGKLKEIEPELLVYQGRYRSFWGDSVIVAAPGELQMIQVPTTNPTRGVVRLKPTDKPHVFRRQKAPGDLREEFRFELDAEGRAVAVWVHSNSSRRIEEW